MSFQKLVVIGAVLMFFFTASTVYAGLSNLRGWDDTPIYGNSTTASGKDIDGEVGYPIDVYGPTANCEPNGKWSLDVKVSSGTLPPGIFLSTKSGKYGDIEGIPTKRGHWIVEMSADNLKCEGKNVFGFTQQLRFHIKGTGRVIQ